MDVGWTPQLGETRVILERRGARCQYWKHCRVEHGTEFRLHPILRASEARRPPGQPQVVYAVVLK
jgi:hypothetical protein